jgi:integrase
MAEDNASKTFRFENGAVYLYQRPNTRIWWTRQRRPDGSGWTRFSTGQEVFEDAVSAALKAYQEASFRHRYGLTPSSRSFREAVHAVMDRLRAEVENGKRDPQYARNAIAYLERYALSFFGDRPIDEITTPDMAAFRQYRATYWTTGPGKDEVQTVAGKNGRTINRRTRHGVNPASGEWSWLRAVFDHAVDQGWIKKERLPEIKATAVRVRRRPNISEEEYLTIERVGLDWIEQGRKGVHERVRFLTAAFAVTLFKSGMRPGEATSLRWKDLDYVTVEGKRYFQLHVRGKTGYRPVIPLPEVENWLDEVRKRHPDTSPDQLVFLTVDHIGQPFQPDFAKPFRNLLEFAGVTHNNSGDRYCLYSLRHAYATERLKEGNIDAHTLARAMGTSTAMMDRHYSHMTATLAAKRLTKRPWDEADEDENAE